MGFPSFVGDLLLTIVGTIARHVFTRLNSLCLSAQRFAPCALHKRQLPYFLYYLSQQTFFQSACRRSKLQPGQAVYMGGVVALHGSVFPEF